MEMSKNSHNRYEYESRGSYRRNTVVRYTRATYQALLRSRASVAVCALNSRLVLKVIAFIISVIFFFTTVTYATPSVYTIKVPDEYGKVTQRYKAPKTDHRLKTTDYRDRQSIEGLQSAVSGLQSEKLIIHVQDAHMNSDAQKNLARIICSLVPQLTEDHRQKTTDNRPRQSAEGLRSAVSGLRSGTKVPFIGIEGAIGEYDLETLRQYPVQEAKEKVGLDIVKEGTLIGAEYANLITDKDFSLFGLENEKLFRENFTAFYDVTKKHPDIAEHVDDLEQAVSELKEKLFTQELAAFEKKMQAYIEDPHHLIDFLNDIYTASDSLKIDLFEYVNLFQFKKVLIAQQQLKPEVLDHEMNILIKTLREVIQNEENKDELMQHVQQYKNKTLSERRMSEYLLAQAVKHSLATQQFSMTKKAVEFNRAYAMVDMSRLMNEIYAISDVIKEHLATSDDEREIVRIDKRLRALMLLFNLKVLKEDAHAFQQNKEAYSYELLTQDIKRLAAAHGVSSDIAPAPHAVDTVLDSVDAFYKKADERDMALVDNLLRKMQQENQSIGVLVAGGYHSQGVTDILKNKGVSFITITPRINSLLEDVAYMDRMMGKIIPVDPILTSHFQYSRLQASCQALGIDLNQHLMNQDVFNRFDVETVVLLAQKTVTTENTEIAEKEKKIDDVIDQMLENTNMTNALRESIIEHRNALRDVVLKAQELLGQKQGEDALAELHTEISALIDEADGVAEVLSNLEKHMDVAYQELLSFEIEQSTALSDQTEQEKAAQAAIESAEGFNGEEFLAQLDQAGIEAEERQAAIDEWNEAIEELNDVNELLEEDQGQETLDLKEKAEGKITDLQTKFSGDANKNEKNDGQTNLNTDKHIDIGKSVINDTKTGNNTSNNQSESRTDVAPAAAEVNNIATTDHRPQTVDSSIDAAQAASTSSGHARLANAQATAQALNEIANTISTVQSALAQASSMQPFGIGALAPQPLWQALQRLSDIANTHTMLVGQLNGFFDAMDIIQMIMMRSQMLDAGIIIDMNEVGNLGAVLNAQLDIVAASVENVRQGIGQAGDATQAIENATMVTQTINGISFHFMDGSLDNPQTQLAHLAAFLNALQTVTIAPEASLGISHVIIADHTTDMADIKVGPTTIVLTPTEVNSWMAPAVIDATYVSSLFVKEDLQVLEASVITLLGYRSEYATEVISDAAGMSVEDKAFMLRSKGIWDPDRLIGEVAREIVLEKTAILSMLKQDDEMSEEGKELVNIFEKLFTSDLFRLKVKERVISKGQSLDMAVKLSLNDIEKMALNLINLAASEIEANDKEKVKTAISDILELDLVGNVVIWENVVKAYNAIKNNPLFLLLVEAYRESESDTLEDLRKRYANALSAFASDLIAFEKEHGGEREIYVLPNTLAEWEIENIKDRLIGQWGVDPHDIMTRDEFMKDPKKGIVFGIGLGKDNELAEKSDVLLQLEKEEFSEAHSLVRMLVVNYFEIVRMAMISQYQQMQAKRAAGDESVSNIFTIEAIFPGIDNYDEERREELERVTKRLEAKAMFTQAA